MTREHGWYIKGAEEIEGPFSARHLKHLADTARIEADTLVRKGLTSGWRPAKELKGLFGRERAASDAESRPTARNAAEVISSLDRLKKKVVGRGSLDFHQVSGPRRKLVTFSQATSAAELVGAEPTPALSLILRHYLVNPRVFPLVLVTVVALTCLSHYVQVEESKEPGDGRGWVMAIGAITSCLVGISAIVNTFLRVTAVTEISNGVTGIDVAYVGVGRKRRFFEIEEQQLEVSKKSILDGERVRLIRRGMHRIRTAAHVKCWLAIAFVGLAAGGSQIVVGAFWGTLMAILGFHAFITMLFPPFLWVGRRGDPNTPPQSPDQAQMSAGQAIRLTFVLTGIILLIIVLFVVSMGWGTKQHSLGPALLAAAVGLTTLFGWAALSARSRSHNQPQGS